MKKKSSQWYKIPDGSPTILHGPNKYQHWIHLKSAEQLAKALYEAPSYDIRHVYRFGGIAEGLTAPEGLVGLYDRWGRLLLIGSYICTDLQFPGTPDGLSATESREKFEEAINVLKEYASDLLLSADVSLVTSRSPTP